MLNIQPQRSGPSPAGIGVLLVGHGTRDPVGADEFRTLFAKFQSRMPGVATAMAFLELSQPDIPTAMAHLARQGVSQVVTVPAILFTAGHAQSDIPDAVNESAVRLGMRVIGQTDALECAPQMLQVSARRFREAACAGDCREGCQNVHCDRTAWVLIGRGSTSPTATAKTRDFFQLRNRLTPTRHGIVAFIHGQQPTVKDALDQVADSDAVQVVVQPHLLFTGQLSKDIDAEVVLRQQASNRLRWIAAKHIGPDSAIAELLAQRATECIQQSQSIRSQQ